MSPRRKKQDVKNRDVLYVSNGQPYARKKRITVTRSGATWSFTTFRNINTAVAAAVPATLRNLLALDVDFSAWHARAVQHLY